MAKTDENAVAYKYDAGLKGLSIDQGIARRVARHGEHVAGLPVRRREERARGAAEGEQPPASSPSAARPASIAAFPPPHTFFWAREIATNLGYNWYRKDSDTSFSFGIRQAEKDEEHPQYPGNFALYSARPGTWQHMPVFFYASAEPADGDARSRCWPSRTAIATSRSPATR